MTQAEQIIKAWQSKGLDTIAVVCIDEAEAEKVTAALQGSVELNTGDAGKWEIGEGVMVLPLKYTKGLEFDAVLIFNASEEDYNKLADAISNADGASKRMSDTMMDNLSGDITLFQSAVDGLKISLGERMSNSWLRDIVQWLTAQVPKAEQLFSDAMDSAERKLDSIKLSLIHI